MNVLVELNEHPISESKYLGYQMIENTRNIKNVFNWSYVKRGFI